MQKKVMIVDDSKIDLNNLQQIVNGLGYITVTAINGEEAIEKSKSETPALIFMDVNMKQVDGFQATRQILADPQTKDIPVVFVTGKNQKADQVWAKMLGAKGYITKPYTQEQIKEEIEKLLN